MDRLLDLGRALEGAVREPLGRVLTLAHDELGFLARGGADVLGGLLRRKERLLEDPLALAVLVVFLLEGAQPGLQVGVLARESFHVLRDVGQERLDLDGVEALPLARELALLNLERGHPWTHGNLLTKVE